MPTQQYKSQHVLPHLDGGWSVKLGGARRMTRNFATKAEAVSYGRKLSKAQGADLYIHRADGLVEKKNSYRKIKTKKTSEVG